MNSKKGKFYIAGKFAEKAGVTLRTIRYYDKKDLLKPTEYSECGYRLYSNQDFAQNNFHVKYIKEYERYKISTL